MNNPLLFSGVQILENLNLTIKVGERTEQVTRSWKERLFTLPWTPLKKTKTVITPIYGPDPNCYFLGKYTVVCHPETAMRLRQAIANKNSLH